MRSQGLVVCVDQPTEGTQQRNRLTYQSRCQWPIQCVIKDIYAPNTGAVFTEQGFSTRESIWQAFCRCLSQLKLHERIFRWHGANQTHDC